MGTRIIKTDDLTGQEVSESELASIEVMFGEEWTGTVELTGASKAAVLALLRDHDTTKLAALLPRPEPKPAGKPRTRKSGSHGGGEHAQAREWCKTPEGLAVAEQIGIMPTDKGRMPEQLVEAWRKANGHALAA